MSQGKVAQCKQKIRYIKLVIFRTASLLSSVKIKMEEKECGQQISVKLGVGGIQNGIFYFVERYQVTISDNFCECLSRTISKINLLLLCDTLPLLVALICSILEEDQYWHIALMIY